MTLNQLKYAIEVASVGSINRAATNLFVSQSVLSTSISKLEAEIGHAIFNRTNQGVSLTPFGRTFISYISPIQDQLQQLDHLIYQTPPAHEFTLSVASTGYYFLDNACADIYKKYHGMGIRIEQYEDHVNNIADMVANASAEIGIVHLWTCHKYGYMKQTSIKGLQYSSIASLDIAVTVGKNNPLFYSEEDSVSPYDLKNYPTVKYTYMDSGPYSDIYRRLKLPDSGNQFIVTSRSTIYELLRGTDAYYLNSIYPSNFLTPESSGPYREFRTLKLHGCDIQSEIGWIKRKNHSLSPPADEIVNRITQFFF